MTEWLLIGLLAGLAVGLAVAFHSQRKTNEKLESQNHNLLSEVRHANKTAREAQEKMIDQVIRMRQEGYQTIPPDEQFDTYRITPEQEAEWEDQRAAGVGGLSPESIVEEV